MVKVAFLSRRRARRLALVGLVAGVAVWLGLSLVIGYWLTRRAKPVFAQPAPIVTWAQWEDVRLTTRDGLGLGAWYTPGEPHLPALILLHGNRGSRQNTLWLAELLAPRGHAILAVSLRAHGDSDGEINDFGRGAALDVVAAVEFLEARAPGVPIVVRGSSLGSAAAIFAASELDHRVAGYVLECPYRDLTTAVRNRTRAILPPVAEYLAYAGLRLVGPLLLNDIDGISPRRAIARFPPRAPSLIMAGSEDRLATLSEATELQNCVGENCQLVVFEGGGHGRFRNCNAEQYDQSLRDFLRQFEAR